MPHDQLRAEIAQLSYTGPESVQDAQIMRQKMAATVEVAKRAGADESHYRRLAREAERKLGQMLTAARAAGDLAGEGKQTVATIDSLATLGIGRDLAADASLFARIPDDLWSEYLGQVTTRTGLVNLARGWLTESEKLDKQRAEQARKLAELAVQAPDLHALVSDGHALDEQWAAYEKRTEAARKAAAERKQWAKELRDGFVGGVLDIGTAWHPNNWDALLQGLREHPPADLFAMTPERLREAATQLQQLADRFEAQS